MWAVGVKTRKANTTCYVVTGDETICDVFVYSLPSDVSVAQLAARFDADRSNHDRATYEGCFIRRDRPIHLVHKRGGIKQNVQNLKR